MQKNKHANFTGKKHHVSCIIKYNIDEYGNKRKQIISETYAREATFDDVYIPAKRKERIEVFIALAALTLIIISLVCIFFY